MGNEMCVDNEMWIFSIFAVVGTTKASDVATDTDRAETAAAMA
jgi:hypothetical protein